MGVDVPNAFIQTKTTHKEKGEILMMKTTGALVDMLLKLDPWNFKGYLVYEKGQKLIYMVILREIYEILVALLIWYQNFKKYLK